MERSSRLSLSRDFKTVYQKGYKVSAGVLRLHVLARPGQGNRVGFSIRGKFRAVDRNRLKRYLREAYRLNQAGLKRGFDLVVVAREPLKHKNFWEVEGAMRKAFRKGRLWSKDEKNPSLVD